LSSKKDIYDKEKLLVSIDRLSPELLHELAEISVPDPKTEKLKEALEFAIGFITEHEMELLFFRFIRNDSYKTLKRTVRVGSTKTAAKHTKKLKTCLDGYAQYYMEEGDYENDLNTIEVILGKDCRKVADMLFRRMSKNKIQKSKDLVISGDRLTRSIYDIHVVCLRNIQLNPFAKVLENVGKISKRNK